MSITNLPSLANAAIVFFLEGAYKKAFEAGEFSVEEFPEPKVEVPKTRANGDLSTNFAMQLAKPLKKAPLDIAKILLSHIDFEGSLISRAEAAAPGFINFYLAPEYFSKTISAIHDLCDDYGKTDFGGGKTVMVEFVSANPTGPMHIGNARGGALGDSLAEVLSWSGFDVTREFYVNDAGNQIDRFFSSLDARYKQIFLGEENVPFPEDGYLGEDIKDRVREFADEFGDKLLSLSEEERKNALVPYALKKNVDSLKSDLERYRIFYDIWFFESSLYEDNEVSETLDILTENGYTYKKDGAVFFKASDFGCEKDEVLVRANGLATYFLADIAYHRNKLQKRNFDLLIDVWGADHFGHIQRIKGALSALSLNPDKFEVVTMQLVRLLRDGEATKVSKRSGKAISLSDLLDEVGVDAARFFFNLNKSDSHMEFDLDLAVEQSTQNPVYYVQYAHARICSILKMAMEEKIEMPKSLDTIELNLLESDEERELILKLSFFPEEIKGAALSFEPARITRYAIDLAALFHKFYNAHRVMDSQSELRFARLALCESVKTVIKNALTILGISAPEKM